MELKDILSFVTGGGAAVITFWLLSSVDYLSSMPPLRKRFAAIALSAILAVAAYMGQVGMTYLPAPLDARAWIEALVLVGSGAFGLSQVIHGLTLSNTAKA